MSAAPLPKPEPDIPATGPSSSDADAEGWALLEALRRRLDDQGAQGRKTQHQVTQLAESIGALVAEQRRRSKWANLNSFVAYLIFTLLVGAGFYMLYRSRAHELVEARDAAQRERDQATRRADDAEAKVAARTAADTKAWEVYQLLDAGKRSEAAGKLAALGDLPLSRTERAVLAARAHETQVMEVDAALKAAAGSFRGGRYAEVIAPLEAALVSEPAGARASTMRYYLGVAYAKGNQLDKAVALLSAAIAADVEQEDARFQLASALDRAGQYARARTEYDRFATAHPQSQLAVFAMRRSATLARMPATAPVAAPSAGQTPPSGGQTAPSGGQTPPVTKPPATTPPAPAPTKAPAAVPAPAVKAPAPKPAAPPTKPATPPAAKSEPATDTGAAAPSSDPTPMAALPLDLDLDANAVEPLSLADTGRPSKAKEEPKAPPPKQDPTPAPTPEPPRAEPPRAEPPKLPPTPRAEPLPSFPIDRTPPPSPLGPPVERDPSPSPNAPPRGDVPPPPPSRF